MNLKPWANHSVEIGKIGIRMLAIILTLGAICPFGRGQEKRAVCVGDAIAMTRLADPSYFRGVPADGKVGDYSPQRGSLHCRSEEGRSIHGLEFVFDLPV